MRGRRRFRGIRRLRRARVSKRQARIPRAVAKGVRKVVGDCYNQHTYNNNWVHFCPTFPNRLSYPFLFGICTHWFQDRADYMNAINRFMTVDQYDKNTHLYPQNCHTKFFLRNPHVAPVHVEIIKMTVKCSGGQASGAYVAPTTTTMAAPDIASLNELTKVAFDQRMRDTDVANCIVNTGLADNILAQNINPDGSTQWKNPVVGEGTPWEQYQTASAAQTVNEAIACKMRLSWIFPRIHEKFDVKTVFSGWIRGWSTKAFRVEEKWPEMITPQQMADVNNATYRKGESHFYFMRAFCKNDIGSNENATATTTDTIYRVFPTYVQMRLSRQIGCRQSGDHVPTYTSGPFPFDIFHGNNGAVTQQFSAATAATSDAIAFNRDKTGAVTAFFQQAGNGVF